MLILRGRVSLPIFANTIIKSGDYNFGDVYIAMVLNELLVWWEHHNDDDVLFLFFDDLKEDHAGCVSRIAKFIGIVDCAPRSCGTHALQLMLKWYDTIPSLIHTLSL